MNLCKAQLEDQDIIGDGTVVFYIDSVSRNIVFAIDGQDNKKYYSFNGVRDGVLAYPHNLTYWDMWLTQNHSLPEIKGFIKLAKESKETFAPKDQELHQKFNKWGKNTIYGKISCDGKSMIVLSDKKENLANLLMFFVTCRFIDTKTFLYENDNPIGAVGQLLVNNSTPIVLPEPDPAKPEKDYDSYFRYAQNDYTEDVEVLNWINKYKMNHDGESAEKLIEKYSNLMRGIIGSYSRLYRLSPEVVEDILHSCYVKFLTKLTDYDASKGTLSTYVYNTVNGLVKNILIKRKRDRGREKTVLDVGADEEDEGISPSTVEQKTEPTPSANMEQQEQTNEIQNAINELPQKHQKIINLYFYSGKTLEAIGQEMGVSKERIRQIVEESLMALRHRLTKVEALKLAMIFDKLEK